MVLRYYTYYLANGTIFIIKFSFFSLISKTRYYMYIQSTFVASATEYKHDG